MKIILDYHGGRKRKNEEVIAEDREISCRSSFPEDASTSLQTSQICVQCLCDLLNFQSSFNRCIHRVSRLTLCLEWLHSRQHPNTHQFCAKRILGMEKETMRSDGLFIFLMITKSSTISDLKRLCEILDHWDDWIFDKELKDRALEREIT